MRLPALVHVQDAQRREESGRVRRAVRRGPALRGRTALPRLRAEPAGLQPAHQVVHLQGVQGEGAEPGSRPEGRHERDARGAGAGRNQGPGRQQSARPRVRRRTGRSGRRTQAGYVERLHRRLREGLPEGLERRTAGSDLRQPRPQGHHARELGRRGGEAAQERNRSRHRRVVQRVAQPYRPLRRDAAQHHASAQLAPHSGGAAGREGAAARARSVAGYRVAGVLDHLRRQ